MASYSTHPQAHRAVNVFVAPSDIGRSLSGFTAFGKQCQDQLRVVCDISHMPVVADEADPAAGPLQPHKGTGPRGLGTVPDGDHFAAVEPGGGECDGRATGIDAEEHADLGAAGAR